MSNVRNLTEAKAPADEGTVAMLEMMLERAKAGEIIGLVCFGFHTGGVCSNHESGDTDFSAVLVAFESWKFLRLAEIHLTRG